MVYWGRLGALRSLGFAQGPVSEWRRRHTGMIQPPLLAQAVEAVHKSSEGTSFLEEILPATTAYYDWIARERDAAGDGLVSIISPFECGLDNSPAFDSDLGLRNPSRMGVLWALKKLDLFNTYKGFDFSRIARADRFVVIDPFVNTVYAEGLHTLSQLHDIAGKLIRIGAGGGHGAGGGVLPEQSLLGRGKMAISSSCTGAIGSLVSLSRLLRYSRPSCLARRRTASAGLSTSTSPIRPNSGLNYRCPAYRRPSRRSTRKGSR